MPPQEPSPHPLRTKLICRFAFTGLLLAATAAPARTQELQVAAQEPPYYVGEPVIVQLVVRGFDQQPQPTVDVRSPSPGVTVQVASISPKVSQSTRIVQDPATGRQRIAQTRSVVYVIECRATATATGEATVGPFVVTQGNQTVQADSRRFRFEKVPEDPEMRVRLVLPDQPVYPGERVPVEVEWWYAGDLDAVRSLHIHSPLFDEFDFAPDPQPTRRSNILPIDTEDGQISLEAQVRHETEDERTFTVVSARRTMVPDRPGEHAIAPITATARKVTEWSRRRSPFEDMGFGGSPFDDLMDSGRQPAKQKLVRATGRPITLVVKPFPAEDRPDSFAGAVGRGLSIDVSADRSVVHVGDPITLDVTLQGAGNLENARLPKLSADGGLDPKLFRFSEQEVAGVYEDQVKRFRVSVRVQDESVAEIPAIAYSWFDPDKQTYDTARSKPIALRVMPAKIVSADDVVSGTGHPQERETRDGESHEVATAAPAAGRAVGRPFTLSDVDLSIETDVDVLRRNETGSWAGFFHTTAYVLGLLVVAVALLDRRRRDVPPELLRRKKVLREQQRRIERSGDLPGREAAEEIASALRTLLAELPGVGREPVQEVIAACESLVYAPAGTDVGSIDPALVQQAVSIVDDMSKEAA